MDLDVERLQLGFSLSSCWEIIALQRVANLWQDSARFN